MIFTLKFDANTSYFKRISSKFMKSLRLLLFLGALYVAWVFFYVGLFSVRTFFFHELDFI
jgi:hypothetical protein